MSVIEAVTMAAGLAYLVLLAWQTRSGWQWRLALGLLLMLWLLAADSLLWLGVGLVAGALALWHHLRPLPALEALDSQWLRVRTRQLLLLCWGLVTLQYGLHVWQLGQGMSPWLVRPDVVDGFLPIAGGLGLRAWLGQGLVDPHHPAATVTVLVLSLSALLLGRAFCGVICFPVEPTSHAATHPPMSPNRWPCHDIEVPRGIRPMTIDTPYRPVTTTATAM